jgi:predicted TPR repeat methyltransferase
MTRQPFSQIATVRLPDGTTVSVPAAIQAAAQLHHAGRLRKAEAIYKQVLQAEPENVDALHLLGLVARQFGNHEMAVELIGRAIRLNPKVAMFHNNLAETYRTMDKPDEAVTHCDKALVLQPDFPEALYNLAMALRAQDRLDEAIARFEQAIRSRPDFIDAYVGLSETLHKQRKSEEALACLQKGLSIRPDHPTLLCGVGIVLGALGRHDEAIQHYKQALVIRPDVAELNYNLAAVYRNQGNLSEAATCLRKVIETNPDKNTMDTARHLLAVLQQVTTERAPEGYVVEMFDNYAQTFDQHLVDKLKYRVPRLLGDEVKKFLRPALHKPDVLDMGCGTGLVGLELREISRRLVGIDLSAKMIAKARERAIYDDLVIGDLLERLKELPQDSFDLATSADVFIYVGKLDQVFENCRRILRPGGLFAFSLEAASDENHDFSLHTTGRYQHSRAYIHKLSQRFDFAEIHFAPIHVRKEKNEPVPGYIYLLSKQEN